MIRYKSKRTIKKERIHVIVERLVVKEQLGNKAQIAAIRLLLMTVKLKKGQRILAVNLHSRVRTNIQKKNKHKRQEKKECCTT